MFVILKIILRLDQQGVGVAPSKASASIVYEIHWEIARMLSGRIRTWHWDIERKS